MKYEKLSPGALGCMYTATALGSLVVLLILGALNLFLFFPFDIDIGKLLSAVAAVVLVLNLVISPYFRYHRYRYGIDDECIDIVEGYLFQERSIVPIERLHKIQILRGPIDQIFHVEKVVVTTAGGDVTIRFLEEEKAERIAENLKKRINQIAIESRQVKQDGK